MVKEHSEALISKRKEFIQNYRKKQRLLTLIESNTKNNINNAKDYKEISIEDIKKDPDPISRIIMFKNYIYSNQSGLNINFVNDNINIIREWFKDYKKYLFNYQNKNLSKQIVINRAIIYNILSLLLEPETNPIMDEIDYEFLFNINNFSFYYFNSAYSKDNLSENILLYLYILFLLNNLIVIHPDVELIKATIDIRNIINLIYTKFFSFEESKNTLFYQKIQNKNSSNESENDNNLKFNNKYELFEFTFLKLIENCINYLHLNDNDIKELLSFLLSFVYYNYKNNKIKLFIYSLESLTRVNRSYLLLQNDYYNNFLLTILGEFFHNFSKNNNNKYLFFLKNKLILELYLQRILLFLNSYNNSEKIINKNIEIFLNEEIIRLFKKYLYTFYNEVIFNKNNKREITIPEIKIIVKIIKIFCLYFDLISINNDSNNNSNIIYLNIKNKIAKFLCSIFILKNEEIPISLCDIILNIFTYFIKLNEKNSKKICVLVIDLFNNIYTSKNINLYKDDFYFIELQRILINDKINIHRVLLPFLSLDKYPFLIENLLEFINKTFFFCEQYDNYQKDKTSLFEKINKEYIDLNAFEEIENIECNSINLNIKIISENILDNFVRNQNED